MKLERDRMKARTEAVEAQMKAMQVSQSASALRHVPFVASLSPSMGHLFSSITGEHIDQNQIWCVAPDVWVHREF